MTKVKCVATLPFTITDPNELPKVLGEALKVVKDGKPALMDVVCEMRP